MGVPVQPREKLRQLGSNALGDDELLALLLRTGAHSASPSKPKTKNAIWNPDVIQLARRLIHHFNGLNGIFQASAEELESHRGMGPAKVASILAAQEIALRTRFEFQEKRFVIDSCEAAAQLFHPICRNPQETLVAAFLNTGNQVLRTKEIFRGALDHAIARPREILREALRANAAKIVVAHNHPSQDCTPSKEDHDFTHKLIQAIETIGLTFVDHLIVTETRYYSFAYPEKDPPPP